MGYFRHDAIAVTSFNEPDVKKAHAKAEEIGLSVTPISAVVVNGYCSFMICPDGSKEGWSESNEGNEQRAAWIDWAKTEGQSLCLDWIHISFGGDDPDQAAIHDYAQNIEE